MANLTPTAKQLYLSNAGLPLAGGKVYTYDAGTSTPRATYSDQAGTVPNTNPVILDSRGEALIFWLGSYKVVLKDALDNTIWTVDNVIESNGDIVTGPTGSLILPAGSTAQRDVAPVPGYLRYNLSLGGMEAYIINTWKPVATGVLDAGDVYLNTTQTLTNKTITGLFETKTAMAALNIDASAGNWFTKTITAITTFTVSNVPATDTAECIILDLTNGGAFAITWWANVKWPSGVAPVLTAVGRDVLGFFTHNGGATWTGLVLGKDVK